MKFKKFDFKEYSFNVLSGLGIPEILLNNVLCHSCVKN